MEPAAERAHRTCAQPLDPFGWQVLGNLLLRKRQTFGLPVEINLKRSAGRIEHHAAIFAVIEVAGELSFDAGVEPAVQVLADQPN